MQSDPLNPENSRICNRPQTTVGVLWGPGSSLLRSESAKSPSKRRQGVFGRSLGHLMAWVEWSALGKLGAITTIQRMSEGELHSRLRSRERLDGNSASQQLPGEMRESSKPGIIIIEYLITRKH